MPRPTTEKSPPEAILPRRMPVRAQERAAARLQRLLPCVHELAETQRKVDGLAAVVATRQAIRDLVAWEVPACQIETELGTLTWEPTPEAFEECFDLDRSRARRAV